MVLPKKKTKQKETRKVQFVHLPVPGKVMSEISETKTAIKQTKKTTKNYTSLR